MSSKNKNVFKCLFCLNVLHSEELLEIVLSTNVDLIQHLQDTVSGLVYHERDLPLSALWGEGAVSQTVI